MAMQPMSFRQKILLAAIQSTSGVPVGLTGANAIDVNNLVISYQQGDAISKEVDRLGEGNFGEIKTKLRTELSFEVYAAGAGAAGTAPGYGLLLRACGYAETIDAGNAVTYELADGNYEMITAAFMRVAAGNKMQQHVIDGARGLVELSLKEGELPKFSFSNMMGGYNDPSEVAVLTPDTSAFKDPVPPSAVNTPTAKVDNIDVALTELTLASGGTVERIDRPNQKETALYKLQPTGKMTFIAPASLATANWFSKTRSDNGVQLSTIRVVHGTVAGNIIELEVTAQLTNLSESEVNGQVAYSFDLKPLPNASNVGIKITVR